MHASKVDPSGQREDARDLKVQVHVERSDLHAEAKKAQRIAAAPRTRILYAKAIPTLLSYTTGERLCCALFFFSNPHQLVLECAKKKVARERPLPSRALVSTGSAGH